MNRLLPRIAGPILILCLAGRPVFAQVTAEAVRKAIGTGTGFLKRQQDRTEGSWPESALPAGGVSALVMLALLESGTKPDDPVIDRGLRYLRTVKPAHTYVVSLQTMVYCLARPQEDMGRIKQNVLWLEEAQVKGGQCSGMWGYGLNTLRGDNSNTQYALLGLREPAELGVPVDPKVWQRSREHFLQAQTRDGGWGYEPGANSPTGSMTVAGISSLIIAGLRIQEGQEKIENGVIKNCGQWQQNEPIVRGLDWLGRNFQVRANPAAGGGWHYYYLYGLERAARLSGQRFIGQHDWYREGADWLVKNQVALQGNWQSGGLETELVATSFALLFLAKGRAPVLLNKLRHDAADPRKTEDWNNDRNDVRNLTEHVGRHWERRMTWQVVDAKVAAEGDVPRRIEDMLQAPVLFITGHEAPVFNDIEKKVLRGYVDQGGFILAEACCSRKEFGDGFRQFCREVFPEQPLKVLSPDHAIWTADYKLQADQSLEGIDIGCRTSVVFSPLDLSCYWEQWDRPESVRALYVGSNVLAYATGKELLPDKLEAERKLVALAAGGPASRWTLKIGKLKHGGDWNVAPLAVPNLMASLSSNLKMDVAAQHQELTPLDENLFRYPFIYMHGRSQFNYTDQQIAKIREHLDRDGTLFADSCCGHEPFNTAFRAFVEKLFTEPDRKLKQIPVDHELFGGQVGTGGSGGPLGYDLRKVQYTRAMPRPEGEPFLEGIEINGRWVVIYSKWDIGCALERHQGSDCRGYTHESAVKIATNVILYALYH